MSKEVSSKSAELDPQIQAFIDNPENSWLFEPGGMDKKFGPILQQLKVADAAGKTALYASEPFLKDYEQHCIARDSIIYSRCHAGDGLEHIVY